MSSPGGPYEAVIFDMGDIFFDATLWRQALTKHLQGQGVAIDYPGLCRRWETCLVEVYLGRREYWDAFRGFLADLGLEGDRLKRAVAFARRQTAQVEDRTLFGGVAETLARLKARGLKLAVLSDTESPEPRVRRRLAEMGIEAYFDAVVTSVDIGHVKPEPEAFEAALGRLGVEVAQAVFVGHDEDELLGAHRVGLVAVAYNAGDGVPADYHLGHFSELEAVVSGARRPEE